MPLVASSRFGYGLVSSSWFIVKKKRSGEGATVRQRQIPTTTTPSCQRSEESESATSDADRFQSPSCTNEGETLDLAIQISDRSQQHTNLICFFIFYIPAVVANGVVETTQQP
ncbi:hypothetical protein Drorol1_Dr00013064 [Drosera rotundifolia]